MTDPTLRMPGEGENFAMGGSSFSLKATSEATDGGFFLSETMVEPDFAGPPLHIHHKLTDMFYVLEGVLTFRMPPGTFNVPGGFETYMREPAAAWEANGGPPDPATIGELASHHDFEVA